MPPAITDHDALASLESKFALVRDRVTALHTGHQTGFYLCGSSGIGKSHTVLGHLDQREANYKLFNSRMTARGLYRALEQAPDAIHVLEDMERLTNDRDAQGVLRSALWSQPGRDRVVTWTTGTDGEKRFIFRGGIIMIANRPLAALPELKALATRIAVLRLEVTDAEAAALMRHLAAQGYWIDGKCALESAECLSVTEYVIGECRAVGCPLDLRLQANSYKDYLLWESEQTQHAWEVLVSSRVQEAAHHFSNEPNTLTREQRHAELRRVIKEIMQETDNADEREKLYQERTGKSRADYYRRKRELESGEFPDDEA